MPTSRRIDAEKHCLSPRLKCLSGPFERETNQEGHLVLTASFFVSWSNVLLAGVIMFSLGRPILIQLATDTLCCRPRPGDLTCDEEHLRLGASNVPVGKKGALAADIAAAPHKNSPFLRL